MLETKTSRAIVKRYFDEFLDSIEVDVAIVGGGPSGLVASKYIADKGHKVVLFERKLSLGGGIWGGGMMFNKIVVEEDGKEILDEFGVSMTRFENTYVASSIETAASLILGAVKSGVRVMNLISVEAVSYTHLTLPTN